MFIKDLIEIQTKKVWEITKIIIIMDEFVNTIVNELINIKENKKVNLMIKKSFDSLKK